MERDVMDQQTASSNIYLSGTCALKGRRLLASTIPPVLFPHMHSLQVAIVIGYNRLMV